MTALDIEVTDEARKIFRGMTDQSIQCRLFIARQRNEKLQRALELTSGGRINYQNAYLVSIIKGMGVPVNHNWVAATVVEELFGRDLICNQLFEQYRRAIA